MKMYAILIASNWTQAGSQTVWVCLLTDLSHYHVPSEYIFLNALGIQQQPYLGVGIVTKPLTTSL